MAREYFCAYHSMLGALEPLNDAECGRLLKALLMYSMANETPELRGNERFVFPMFKAQIDRDRETYEAKCASSRANVMKRWNTKDTAVYDGIPTDTKHTKTKTKNNKESISKDIPKKAGAAFTPPSLDDVKEYVAEKGYDVDPATFYNFFTEGSWKDSKGQPVRNWKQKIITWQAHQTKPAAKKMGANAGYEQHKISDAEFDALFESEGF